MRLHPRALSAALIATLTIADAAASMVRAGVVPDFGIDWATIGAPGNAAYDGPNGAFSPPVQGRGSVPYEYRLAKTEITQAQWFEFIEGYAPFVADQDMNASRFTGGITHVIGFDADGVPIYKPIEPERKNFSVGVSWRFAARLANWLHNGKAITRDAFETGAYDTSTFGEARDENGNFLGFTDQLTHAPDARFWLPTLDEWMKGAYYDPNRFGPGQGGWWMHPGGQDEPLTPGLPGEPGAQTSAGLTSDRISAFLLNVGLYPDVNAPWGLLDTSGLGPEWLEEANNGSGTLHSTRFLGGSRLGDPFFHTIWDSVNEAQDISPRGPAAIRLASAVPTPGSVAAVLGFMAILGIRRQR